MPTPAVFIRFQAYELALSHYMHTDQGWTRFQVIFGKVDT